MWSCLVANGVNIFHIIVSDPLGSAMFLARSLSWEIKEMYLGE